MADRVLGDPVRLLVGYDGRESGDDALALARLLGAPDAQVLALVAIPFPPDFVGDPPERPRPRARTWGELCEELTREGEELLARRTRPQLDGFGFEPRVVLDDRPGRALTATCEDEQPDLVVVGSSNRGRLGQLLPGSTTERLLSGSPSPVAVAPRGFAERSPDHLQIIGVGFNGSDTSARALATAVELAARAGAELRVIAVVEPQAIGELEAVEQAIDILADREVIDHRAERLRSAADELLGRLDVDAEVEVEHGDAAEVLLDASRELDLLVLGSRGYGPLRRVLLGSVSNRIVREAGRPVVVTPRPG